jgi:hypothetical protein
LKLVTKTEGIMEAKFRLFFQVCVTPSLTPSNDPIQEDKDSLLHIMDALVAKNKVKSLAENL